MKTMCRWGSSRSSWSMRRATSIFSRPSSISSAASASRTMASCNPTRPTKPRRRSEVAIQTSPALCQGQAPKVRKLILAPQAQQVGTALGKQIPLGGLALQVEQAPPCRLQIKQQLAVGRIANQTAHPSRRREPLSAADRRDPMQGRRRIDEQAPGRKLERLLAGGGVDDQLATVVV